MTIYAELQGEYWDDFLDETSPVDRCLRHISVEETRKVTLGPAVVASLAALLP